MNISARSEMGNINTNKLTHIHTYISIESNRLDPNRTELITKNVLQCTLRMENALNDVHEQWLFIYYSTEIYW